MLDPTPPSRPDVEDQLALFFRAWAVVVYYDRAVRGTMDTVWSVAIVLCAMALAWRPRSLHRVAALSTVHLAWYLRGYAARADVHWHIAAMVHLAILTTLGACWVRRGRATGLADLHPGLAPVARWTFVIMAASAGFAKLNTGFLDPSTSCAVALLEFQRTAFLFSIIPAAGWVGTAAMWGTIAAEIGAPLLLVLRPTRALGFVVTLGFFLFIGTNPVGYLFEFAGEFVALSVFFATPRAIASGLAAIAPAARFGLPRLRWLGLAAALLLSFGTGPLDLRTERLTACRAVYVLGLALYAAVLALGGRSTRGATPGRLPLFPRPLLAFVVPVVLFVGEASTYVGLKHVPTMTMAGNNAVSTAWSNHLLVNPVPDWGFNRVVKVVASSDKRLPAGTERVWLAFSDWMARHPKAVVDYRVAGDRALHHVDAAVDGRRAGEPFARSVWPALLRLDSQVFPRRSPDCGHRVDDAGGRAPPAGPAPAPAGPAPAATAGPPR